MRIKKIYINAFGGLKDFTLEFNDNMNVIFGENENGKTTVMSFIKAMFYGTGNKTKSISTSIRAKFTPFDQSQMGGRIYFENDNKEYILERQFFKSDSTDKVTLTNSATGESVSVPSDIGTKLFGMGADAFSNSLFIGSESITLTDEAVGELNARLSSVALTGNDNTSLKQIESNIEKAKEKVLSKSGRAGLLFKAKAELEDLNIRLKNAKSDAVRKCEINEQKDKLIIEGKALSEEYLNLKKITDSKDDIKNAEKLNEYLSLKDELDKLNETLKTPNGKILDAKFVSGVKFAIGKLEAQREKCAEIEKDIEEIKKLSELSGSMSIDESTEKLNNTKSLLSTLENKKNEFDNNIKSLECELENAEKTAENEANSKKSPNMILLIIGIICAVCGTVSGIITGPIFLVSAMFGLLLVVLSFIFKPNNDKKLIEIKENIADIKGKIAENKNSFSEVLSRISSETANMNMLLSVINADNTVKEQRANELKLKQNRLDEENQKLSALKEETEKTIGGMEIDVSKLDLMEKNAEIQKDLKLKLNYLSRDLGGISYEQAREKLNKTDLDNSFSDDDFGAAEIKKEEIGEKMTAIRENITALETELKTSFRNSEQPEIIEREINELLEKIKNYSLFVETSDIALEVLNESFSSIRSGYGSVLTEKTLDVFKKLSNGRYKTISVSKSFEITAEQSDIFGMHDIGYLSQGTVDQALLSLRLAIIELISENEPLPIMLDDALSNFDDARTAEALKFLKEFSGRNQVILFTCHNSVVNIAKQNGIESVKLK